MVRMLSTDSSIRSRHTAHVGNSVWPSRGAPPPYGKTLVLDNVLQSTTHLCLHCYLDAINVGQTAEIGLDTVVLCVVVCAIEFISRRLIAEANQHHVVVGRAIAHDTHSCKEFVHGIDEFHELSA